MEWDNKEVMDVVWVSNTFITGLLVNVILANKSHHFVEHVQIKVYAYHALMDTT